MVSSFYKQYGKTMLWIVAISFPVLLIQAETLPINNDIETWLPRDSEVRNTYQEFKKNFGAEEVVLIGLSAEKSEPQLVESVCKRIERLEGINKCWSAERLRQEMRAMSVPEEEMNPRLNGFLIDENGKLVGIIAGLSPAGLKDRQKTVREIRQQLSYCQFQGDDFALAGSPVVVSELDQLGSSQNNNKYFLMTLCVSLCLLYYTIRRWMLTIALLGLTVWAINLSLTIVKLTGGESNFILSAMPVMVMVFTLAICIHFLQYYRTARTGDCARDQEDPLGAAMRLAFKPCFLATLTTTIGLISLTISDIAPVRQFGFAAAIGSVVALLTGLGLTPAALSIWSPCEASAEKSSFRFSLLAHGIVNRSRPIAIVAGLVVAVTFAGVMKVRSQIDPLEFLPKNNKVLGDVYRIEDGLAHLDSIETVVDFGERDLTLVEKLDEVRRIEAMIRSHENVQCTISPAMFFPVKMPDSAMETARVLRRAESRQDQNSDYVADGARLWRISARMTATSKISRTETFHELSAMLADEPVELTGIAPLLEEAQQSIFDGFWKSFGMAFIIITVVMMISLGSWKTGLLAMIPNFTPICIVFGTLGWLDVPVDIGMMMTASIALGIAVDGTFHFLVHYQSRYREDKNSPAASRDALLQTGAPIFKAAVIAALGMLALTLSPFTPTARFGYMMATLLAAAVVGDLLLLPAILGLRSDGSSADLPENNESSEQNDSFFTDDDNFLKGPHLIKPPQFQQPPVQSSTSQWETPSNGTASS